jgi:hypothetical protein
MILEVLEDSRKFYNIPEHPRRFQKVVEGKVPESSRKF